MAVQQTIVIRIDTTQALSALQQLQAEINKTVSQMSTITSLTDKVTQATHKSKDAMRDLGLSLATLNPVLSRFGISLQTFTLGGILGSVVGGVTLSIKTFADFEASMVKVGRITGMASEDLDFLGRRFRDLSLELPVTADNIAEVGAVAGQLGISGVHNIEKFTETIVKMHVSTGASAESLATGLARIIEAWRGAADQARLTEEQISNLASAFLHMENTTTATTADIIDMAGRVAGTASIIGFTAQQTAGLVATIRDLGINVERGSTALNRFLNQMMVDFEGVMEVFEADAVEMAKIMEKDPVEAFLKVLEAANKLAETKGPGALIQALDNITIGSEYTTELMLKLSSAVDEVRKNMENASKAFSDNVTLQQAVQRQLEAQKSKWQEVKNAVSELLRVFGEDLKPITDTVLDFIHRGLDSLVRTHKLLRSEMLKIPISTIAQLKTYEDINKVIKENEALLEEAHKQLNKLIEVQKRTTLPPIEPFEEPIGRYQKYVNELIEAYNKIRDPLNRMLLEPPGVSEQIDKIGKSIKVLEENIARLRTKQAQMTEDIIFESIKQQEEERKRSEEERKRREESEEGWKRWLRKYRDNMDEAREETRRTTKETDIFTETLQRLNVVLESDLVRALQRKSEVLSLAHQKLQEGSITYQDYANIVKALTLDYEKLVGTFESQTFGDQTRDIEKLKQALKELGVTLVSDVAQVMEENAWIMKEARENMKELGLTEEQLAYINKVLSERAEEVKRAFFGVKESTTVLTPDLILGIKHSEDLTRRWEEAQGVAEDLGITTKEALSRGLEETIRKMESLIFLFSHGEITQEEFNKGMQELRTRFEEIQNPVKQTEDSLASLTKIMNGTADIFNSLGMESVATFLRGTSDIIDAIVKIQAAFKTVQGVISAATGDIIGAIASIISAIASMFGLGEEVKSEGTKAFESLEEAALDLGPAFEDSVRAMERVRNEVIDMGSNFQTFFSGPGLEDTFSGLDLFGTKIVSLPPLLEEVAEAISNVAGISMKKAREAVLFLTEAVDRQNGSLTQLFEAYALWVSEAEGVSKEQAQLDLTMKALAYSADLSQAQFNELINSMIHLDQVIADQTKNEEALITVMDIMKNGIIDSQEEMDKFRQVIEDLGARGKISSEDMQLLISTIEGIGVGGQITEEALGPIKILFDSISQSSGQGSEAMQGFSQAMSETTSSLGQAATLSTQFNQALQAINTDAAVAEVRELTLATKELGIAMDEAGLLPKSPPPLLVTFWKLSFATKKFGDELERVVLLLDSLTFSKISGSLSFPTFSVSGSLEELTELDEAVGLDVSTYIDRIDELTQAFQRGDITAEEYALGIGAVSQGLAILSSRTSSATSTTTSHTQALNEALSTAEEMGIITKTHLAASLEEAEKALADLNLLYQSGEIDAIQYQMAVDAVNAEIARLTASSDGATLAFAKQQEVLHDLGVTTLTDLEAKQAEVAEQQKILEQAYNDGMISTQAYQDALKALEEELKETEEAFYGLHGAIGLTSAEMETLTELTEQYNLVTLEDFLAAQEEAQEQLELLDKLLEENQISLGTYNYLVFQITGNLVNLGRQADLAFSSALDTAEELGIVTETKVYDTNVLIAKQINDLNLLYQRGEISLAAYTLGVRDLTKQLKDLEKQLDPHVLLIEDATERVSDLGVITKTQVTEAQKAYNDQLAALQLLLAEGEISWDAYIAKAIEARMALDELTLAFERQGTTLQQSMDLAKSMGIVTADDLAKAQQEAARQISLLDELLSKNQVTAEAHALAVASINEELAKLEATYQGVAYTSPTTGTTTTPTFQVNLLPRQFGGPGRSGGAYLTGERGPEVVFFGPKTHGYFLPTDALAPINVHIVVNGASISSSMDIEDLARKLARAMDRELKLLGRTRVFS